MERTVSHDNVLLVNHHQIVGHTASDLDSALESTTALSVISSGQPCREFVMVGLRKLSRRSIVAQSGGKAAAAAGMRWLKKQRWKMRNKHLYSFE